jgi:hypothetical protein
MKKFIYKTLFFAFAILFFLGATIIICHSDFKFPINERYDANEFNEAFNLGDFNIIAIGNSKMADCLDKDVFNNMNDFSSVFLTNRAANISISKLTLESYLNNCKKIPDIVLLEVSWFSFHRYRTHFEDLGGDLFINDLSLFKYFSKYKAVRPRILKSIYSQLIMQTSFYNKTLFIQPNSTNSTESKSYSFDFEKFITIFPNKTAGVDPELLDDYYSIIDMCKNKNIKLVLFTSPEDEDYSKNQLDKDTIENIFKGSKSRYKNLYYLNYSFGGDFWKKEYENWLRDSHHIYHKDLFSKLLIKDIFLHTSLTKP